MTDVVAEVGGGVSESVEVEAYELPLLLPLATWWCVAEDDGPATPPVRATNWLASTEDCCWSVAVPACIMTSLTSSRTNANVEWLDDDGDRGMGDLGTGGTLDDRVNRAVDDDEEELESSAADSTADSEVDCGWFKATAVEDIAWDAQSLGSGTCKHSTDCVWYSCALFNEKMVS